MRKRRLRGLALICGICVWGCNIFLLQSKQAWAEQLCIAKAACVMEQSSRRILYEQHGDLRLPMASTTKIATAITVLEECTDLSQKIIIPQEAEGIEGSSVYLKSGEEYSVEDLLYGLMLRSGNDCATALALYCGGNLARFAEKMNKISQKAGAINTNFINPHGLPDDKHYTTARDLSYLTCYAMENPTFRKIVSTRYYQPCAWKNKNKLLTDYEAAIGVKTGYTKEAGRCLVSAAKSGNMTLVCTVLNCPTMYETSQCLLDDGFAAYEYTKLIDQVEILEITDGKKTYKAKVLEDFSYPLLKEEKELVEKEIIFNNSAIKRDENGEILGQMKIRLAKQLIFSTNLYKL